MLDQAQTTRLLEESSFLYCQSDPIGAARTIARALKRQQTGGKIAFVRHLVESLDRDDPGFKLRVRAEYRATA